MSIYIHELTHINIFICKHPFTRKNELVKFIIGEATSLVISRNPRDNLTFNTLCCVPGDVRHDLLMFTA